MSRKKTDREPLKHYKKPADFSPEPTFPDDHKYAGKPRCQGWAATVGRQCGRSPIKGRRFCRRHGGRARAGAASGRFKTGRYSKYLPSGLLDNYQTAISDPQLLDLRDEIGLITTRLMQLTAHVQSAETTVKLWRDLKSAYRDLDLALRTQNAEALVEASQVLGRLIEHGYAGVVVWDEIARNVDQRRKLVESERKKMLELHQVITVERLMILIAAISHEFKTVITKHIDDDRTRRELLNDLASQIRVIISR